MALTLYMHPLASYCWKALTALYENDTPFTAIAIDLGDEAQRNRLLALWPIGKFPVLHDESRDRIVPEATLIIEYLDQFHPGRNRFIPQDQDAAIETRLRDRFYDLHLHNHMQTIVGDRLRPADQRDPFGVAHARERIKVALDMIETQMQSSRWAMGDGFTLADCAAAPALYYTDKVAPFTQTHPSAARYLERLLQRPSFARVVAEAQPYAHMFPSD